MCGGEIEVSKYIALSKPKDQNPLPRPPDPERSLLVGRCSASRCTSGFHCGTQRQSDMGTNQRMETLMLAASA